MAERGVVLIGMPGAGKSTVGVLLAKALALAFDDTDILLQTRAGCTLQVFLELHGHLALRKLEEEVLLAVDPRGKVIATGGSAVYSGRAMSHLARWATIIYLEVPLATLLGRLDNFAERGIARPPGQSAAEVFAERVPLYRRYADITVAGDLKSADVVVAEIAQRLAGRGENL